ncbi:MAG: hypothetical protein OEV86_15140 [Candidatus Krumholzibacteria bacterium]|nr:hypothetical protein [Candidatus Krumholzibacteria bacterium]
MSDYETYIEGLGSTIPVNRVSLECAAILLEHMQAMCDPRQSSGQFIEDLFEMRAEWAKQGGDGVVSDVLNALARWEDAEAAKHTEANVCPDNEPHPWNHDTPDEKWGMR